MYPSSAAYLRVRRCRLLRNTNQHKSAHPRPQPTVPCESTAAATPPLVSSMAAKRSPVLDAQRGLCADRKTGTHPTRFFI
jgi:hypothetical protein